MEISYDLRLGVAYIRFRKQEVGLKTIQIDEDTYIDVAPDGMISGIELLNPAVGFG